MYNEEILKKKLVRIEEHIANYLNGLDQADQDDQGTSHYTSEEIKQKLTTDPEARMMRTKDGFACCYNVQTAVDQTSHLIAEYEVTNSCNDYNHLTQVSEAAKKTLEVDTIHVGADKGYDDQDEIEQCIYNGIIPHVGFKNDKTERLLVMEYEGAAITEQDRASTKPVDIQRCLKAGVLPNCYENTIIDIEVQEQSQLSCFIRQPDDTVTCPPVTRTGRPVGSAPIAAHRRKITKSLNSGPIQNMYRF
jgi:transposase